MGTLFDFFPPFLQDFFHDSNDAWVFDPDIDTVLEAHGQKRKRDEAFSDDEDDNVSDKIKQNEVLILGPLGYEPSTLSTAPLCYDPPKPVQFEKRRKLPRPGIEPESLRPQRNVLAVRPPKHLFFLLFSLVESLEMKSGQTCQFFFFFYPGLPRTRSFLLFLSRHDRGRCLL